jgi:hypothetical protein
MMVRVRLVRGRAAAAPGALRRGRSTAPPRDAAVVAGHPAHRAAYRRGGAQGRAQARGPPLPRHPRDLRGRSQRRLQPDAARSAPRLHRLGAPVLGSPAGVHDLAQDHGARARAVRRRGRGRGVPRRPGHRRVAQLLPVRVVVRRAALGPGRHRLHRQRSAVRVRDGARARPRGAERRGRAPVRRGAARRAGPADHHRGAARLDQAAHDQAVLRDELAIAERDQDLARLPGLRTRAATLATEWQDALASFKSVEGGTDFDALQAAVNAAGLALEIEIVDERRPHIETGSKLPTLITTGVRRAAHHPAAVRPGGRRVRRQGPRGRRRAPAGAAAGRPRPGVPRRHRRLASRRGVGARRVPSYRRWL